MERIVIENGGEDSSVGNIELLQRAMVRIAASGT